MLWEMARIVSKTSVDFYVADLALTEVYVLHHHDQVVMSIPEAYARECVLRDLTSLSSLLKDCTGYIDNE